MAETNQPHKKGNVAPGKVNRNWRILEGVDAQLEEEYKRLGYSSKPAFINAHFVKYFSGETIKRDPNL